MFPRTETRMKTMFRRSLDAAIDFATLGEYGYAPAWEVAERANLPDTDSRTYAADLSDWGFDDDAWQRPGQNASQPAAVEPASAAGRALRNAERRSAPDCAGQPLRGRALTPQLPRSSRHRDGMAPRSQDCPDA
jgi:hypothetical protein